MDNRFLPCPFCGGSDVVGFGGFESGGHGGGPRYYTIQCTKCRASIRRDEWTDAGEAKIEELARHCWNRRHNGNT